MDKLTPKQERFCEEYPIDLNQTQAAIRAGYSERTAYSIGNELLKKPEIKARISVTQKKMQERTEIKQESVLKDIQEIKMRCMQVKPVMYFDKVDKEYKQKEEYVIDEETGEEKLVGVYTFDSQAALKACEMLGKHIGLFEKDNNQRATILPVIKDDI